MFGGLCDFGISLLAINKETGTYHRLIDSVNTVVASEAADNSLLLENKIDSKSISMRDYDSILGLSGILRYLLLTDSELYRESIQKVVDALIYLSQYSTDKQEAVPNWHIQKDNVFPYEERESYRSGMINFGLSHGIAGPLAVLSVAKLQGINRPGLAEAIGRLIEFFLCFVQESRHMDTLMSLQMSDPIAQHLGSWSQEINVLSICLRIALAVFLTSVIGCERSSKRHSAGLGTFVLISFSSTICMILDIYLMQTQAISIPILSAATMISAASISGKSILFSSRGQIKGLTTSAALWSCAALGFTIGAGLYTVTLIVFAFLLCILSAFPTIEVYLKNRSNHFEIHLELKNIEYLRDFVTVSRRLGLRIDDIESNPAYVGSGLSVYTITVTICSSELKKYKTHHEIIEALKSLDYIYHLEELR